MEELRKEKNPIYGNDFVRLDITVVFTFKKNSFHLFFIVAFK